MSKKNAHAEEVEQAMSRIIDAIDVTTEKEALALGAVAGLVAGFLIDIHAIAVATTKLANSSPYVTPRQTDSD